MKCIHCENELPNAVGFAKEMPDGTIRRGKLACCLSGCISHGLNSRSQQFRIIVMGDTKEDIDRRTAEKNKKMRQTFKERGISQGDNNPASRKTLMKSGLSPSEIENWLSEKSKKGGRTKKKNGYYDDKSNNPFSTDFWIKQGLNSEQAAEKVNSRIHNKPEFWIARGYSHDKAIVLAGSSADTNSLKAKMEKWGDDGLTKYLETKQKLSDSWTPRSQSGQKFGSSRQANVFFKKLYKFCRKLGYDRDQIYCDLNGKEYFLTHGENIFFYDFTLKPSNVIIEFNGEHVHPNKDLLSEEEWNKWKHAYSKKSANDVFGRDQLKLNTAASNGFSTLTVWSKDPNILELAQNFIRSKS